MASVEIRKPRVTARKDERRVVRAGKKKTPEQTAWERLVGKGRVPIEGEEYVS